MTVNLLRAALCCALAVAASPAGAQRAELISQTELRVCADPHNLPFSNQAREGFENRIADLMGADLKLPVSYVWFPQVIGFVRNTLRARECDLVMGAVSGDGIMDNTNPYYHTGYMIVTRKADGITATSIGDPVLVDRLGSPAQPDAARARLFPRRRYPRRQPGPSDAAGFS